MNECLLHATGLACRTYGGALTPSFAVADCFVQLLPLRGRGEIVSRRQRAAMMAEQTCAGIPPDAGYCATCGADCAAPALKFDPQTLTRKRAAMTGASINAPLRTDLQPNRSQRMLVLCRYLPLLAGMPSDPVQRLQGWRVSQTGRLLMVMFLCRHRHNYSYLIEQEAADCVPWQVRRAEVSIEADWQESITPEALAEVAGVSGSSLFRSFGKT